MKPKRAGRVTVLLSGRGTNFKALYKESRKKNSGFEIVQVISNRSRAAGILFAEKWGIKSHIVSQKKFDSQSAYELEMISLIRQERTDLVCLAGFMKILSPLFIDTFRNRIMNIHPSLLPSFPGLNAQKQAMEYGARISGCTVHFVDNGVDSGPVILQEAVEINDTDDEESLSKKILEQEHRIYPRAVNLWFNGKLKIEGRKVIIER